MINKDIEKFFKHYIDFYEKEANSSLKQANYWLIALGIFIVTLFASLLC